MTNKKEQEWQEVGSEYSVTVRWTEEPNNKWEKENTEYLGDTIQGIFENKMTNIGQNSSNLYKIKTEEHGMLNFWGSTVLDDKLSKVMNGFEIKVSYLGEQTPKSGGKAYKTFNVFFREPDVASDEIKVDAIPY